MRSFRSHTSFPTVGGVAPGIIPGIGWSDHWAFGQYGFQSVMVTDTAPFRYPHYHEPTDTPDKIDTERLRARRQGHGARAARPGALSYGLTSTPPVIGCGTPVVVGKVSGKPLSARTARKAKACASSASADQPA